MQALSRHAARRHPPSPSAGVTSLTVRLRRAAEPRVVRRDQRAKGRRYLAPAICFLISALQLGGAEQHPLLGTWRLVLFENWSSDGSVERPYGDFPSGYLVYDATGRMHVQVMRTPPLPAFPGADDGGGDLALVQGAYQAYIAYYGTYTVDWSRSVVTHTVEGSLQPDYTGTVQTRPFFFEGDRLVIQIRDDSTGECRRREWQREVQVARASR